MRTIEQLQRDKRRLDEEQRILDLRRKRIEEELAKHKELLS